MSQPTTVSRTTPAAMAASCGGCQEAEADDEGGGARRRMWRGEHDEQSQRDQNRKRCRTNARRGNPGFQDTRRGEETKDGEGHVAGQQRHSMSDERIAWACRGLSVVSKKRNTAGPRLGKSNGWRKRWAASPLMAMATAPAPAA